MNLVTPNWLATGFCNLAELFSAIDSCQVAFMRITSVPILQILHGFIHMISISIAVLHTIYVVRNYNSGSEHFFLQCFQIYFYHNGILSTWGSVMFHTQTAKVT